MRRLLPVALVGLLLAALPTALAQDEKPICPEGEVASPEGCSKQAWVDDCPPDMMCAAGGEPGPDEACDDCILYGDGSTCMDGTAAEGSCRDDVAYFSGRGPEDCENCRGVSGDASTESLDAPRTVPAVQIFGVLAAVALAGIVATRHEK